MTEIFHTIQNFDESILLFIQENIRQPWLDGFWTSVTHLGDGGMVWILLAVLMLIPKRTRQAGAAALGGLAAGALITNVIVKNAVARMRPYDRMEELILMIEKQHDFSFPSGHTCASFAAAYAIYRMLPGKKGVPFLILATLISLSRLYVGVHYPSDVIAGAAVGLLAGWAGSKAVKEYMAFKEKRRQERSKEQKKNEE